MIFKTLISTEQLARNLDNPEWVVFDCRFSLTDPAAGINEYTKAHIPNARYANLDADLSSPVTESSGRHPLPDFSLLAKKLGNWGVGNHSQIVIYDDTSGAFAGRMWWLLRCFSHDQVAVLDGGIRQWKKENRELTSALPPIESKSFRPYLNDALWLDTKEVQDGLKSKSIRLLDARTPERYRGEQEPIDPVAGHIPGALNRAFQSNLTEEGLFLPRNKLRKQFEELVIDSSAEHFVHMCGSGVTACHNLLAMDVAGLPNSRLYAGSWSEWIKDTNRPIATDEAP